MTEPVWPGTPAAGWPAPVDRAWPPSADVLPGAAPAVWPSQPYAPPPRTGMPGWAIGLIAGGAALFVVALLAAVALPTFLDQRARAQTPHIPDRIGALTRSSDPAVQAQLDVMSSSMGDGVSDLEAAVFVDVSGAPAVLVITGREVGDHGEENFDHATVDFRAGLQNGLPQDHSLGPTVPVDAGTVGGRVACADILAPTREPIGQACLSARGQAVVVTFAFGPSEPGLVSTVRAAVLPPQ
jgi:hypothetical protein